MEQHKAATVSGWETKLMSPELMAGWSSRSDEALTGRPTTAELIMIRGYTLYPHLVVMLQKSLEDIKLSHVALKDIIVRCMENLMFAISDDCHHLKRELKRRNIKVIDDTVNDGIYYYRYFCRGYEDRFGIMRETMRTELRNMLTAYTNDLGRNLRSGGSNQVTN